MHNLHLQGCCDEGVLIDASTQDTSPLCLLCLHVTFSCLTWLLVYLLGLLGEYYGLHGCAASPADLSCFPACFSCLIDFYNHVSCCINISWRLLFRDKPSRHVFLIGIILVLSWYLSKPMFNKGLWASFTWNLNGNRLFLMFAWSSFGLQSFRKWTLIRRWISSIWTLRISLHLKALCSLRRRLRLPDSLLPRLQLKRYLWISTCTPSTPLSRLWVSLQFSFRFHPELFSSSV